MGISAIPLQSIPSILPHQSIRWWLFSGQAQEEPFISHLVIPETVLNTFMPACLCLCCYFCLEYPLLTSPSGKYLCILQIQLKCQPSLWSFSTSFPPITTNSFCYVNTSLLLLRYSITWLKSPYCSGPSLHSVSYQTWRSSRSEDVCDSSCALNTQHSPWHRAFVLKPLLNE